MSNKLTCEQGVPLMLWFVAWNTGFDMEVSPGRKAIGSDWMCTMYALPDQKVRIEYRFRYYSPDDGDAFSDADLKNWNSVVSTDSGPKVIANAYEVCRTLFGHCISRPGVTVQEEVSIKEGDLLSALKGKHWVQIRTFEAPSPENVEN
jgi:hypothetical protein